MLWLTGNYEGQLGTAGGVPDLIQGCTKLTEVALDCDFRDPEGAFVDSLCSLEHLQHLQVKMDEPYIELPAAALPRF